MGSTYQQQQAAAAAAQFPPVDPAIDAATDKLAAAWALLTEVGTATVSVEEQQAAAAATIAGLLKEHGPILLTRPVPYSMPLVSPSSSSSSLSSLASGSGGQGGLTVIVPFLKALQSSLETAEGGGGRSQGLGRVRQGSLTAISVSWGSPFLFSCCVLCLVLFVEVRVCVGGG
jgi:hypothetical protein